MERKDTIDNIANQLILMDPLKKEHELVTGGLGKILFLTEYYRIDKSDKAINYIIKSIELIFDSILHKKLDFSLAQGYAGIGWLTQYLIKSKIVSKETLTDLIEIDKWVFESLQVDINSHNFDLLYGLIGKGIYFIDRAEFKSIYSQRALNKIFNYLLESSFTDDNGTFWKDFNLSSYNFNGIKTKFKIENHVYNMGLAHGIPSIMSFLCKLHTLNINKEKSLELINNSSKWIITKAKEVNFEYMSHFLDEDQRHITNETSRLAWCYGDLGIAIALFHCAKVLGDESVFKIAKKIAKKATRRLLNESNVWNKASINAINLGFCHGTTGLAHIFYRIYQLTEDDIFIIASKYWLDMTLNHKLENWRGIAGFVRHDLNDDSIYTMTEIDVSLLDGVAGIGLTLLTQEHESTNDWDKIFFTNFDY